MLMRLGNLVRSSSDNGQESEREFALWLKRLEVKEHYAQAYYPHENALANSVVAITSKRLRALPLEMKLMVPRKEFSPNVQ